MMLTVQTREVSAQFADAGLFRQQCFVNGEWVGEGSAAVENPHDGAVLGGLYYQPTILTEVTPECLLMREETFGPVAPLLRFTDEGEVVRMANDTESGLAAYFYTRDIGQAWRVAEALEYWMARINEGVISTEVASFGRVKKSGLGREGSKFGLGDYREIKYLCFDVS
jgi:succinate-semialdehyde dehydrogenase / glutarate-semialdehyde dehydrogenase